MNCSGFGVQTHHIKKAAHARTAYPCNLALACCLKIFPAVPSPITRRRSVATGTDCERLESMLSNAVRSTCNTPVRQVFGKSDTATMSEESERVSSEWCERYTVYRCFHDKSGGCNKQAASPECLLWRVLHAIPRARSLLTAFDPWRQR